MARIKGKVGKSLTQTYWPDAEKKHSRSYLQGLLGEQNIAQKLATLPRGWHVYHDIDLIGENIDHIAVSTKGVFVIEVKNFSGDVLTTPQGVFTHGRQKANSSIAKQCWRLAGKVQTIVGCEVQPLLIFPQSKVKGMAKVGYLPVLNGQAVVTWLLEQPRNLTLDQFKTITYKLDTFIL